MPGVQTRVLDYGLQNLHLEADSIYVCAQNVAGGEGSEATTYTEATSTLALGSMNFGAGAAVGAPATASPNGSFVTTAAVTSGNVAVSGTAGYFAICDTVNSRLCVTGTLSMSQVVAAGNTFSLGSFTVRLPSQ